MAVFTKQFALMDSGEAREVAPGFEVNTTLSLLCIRCRSSTRRALQEPRLRLWFCTQSSGSLKKAQFA